VRGAHGAHVKVQARWRVAHLDRLPKVPRAPGTAPTPIPPRTAPTPRPTASWRDARARGRRGSAPSLRKTTWPRRPTGPSSGAVPPHAALRTPRTPRALRISRARGSPRPLFARGSVRGGAPVTQGDACRRRRERRRVRPRRTALSPRRLAHHHPGLHAPELGGVERNSTIAAATRAPPPRPPRARARWRRAPGLPVARAGSEPHAARRPRRTLTYNERAGALGTARAAAPRRAPGHRNPLVATHAAGAPRTCPGSHTSAFPLSPLSPPPANSPLPALETKGGSPGQGAAPPRAARRGR